MARWRHQKAQASGGLKPVYDHKQTRPFPAVAHFQCLTM